MADTPEFSDLNQNISFESALQNQAPVAQEPMREPAQQQPAATPEAQINVWNPEGSLVSIPSAQLPEALQGGYKLATPEHIDQYKKEQKFGTTEQAIKAGLEGAASAATFGLSTGLERALGVKPEDIQARREVNPGARMVGEIGGLLGSAVALPETGATALLGKAGQAAAEAIGLAQPVTTLAKIGSGATKMAIENAIFQGGDEVAKMLASDPDQSVSTAAISMGLAGVLGGGLGAAGASVSPLWKATLGGKTGGVLKAVADKVGGIDGITPDPIKDAIKVSGMDIEPEVLARLSNDPEIQMLSKTLEQSDTTGAGLHHQEALKKFKEDSGSTMIRALGKDPNTIGAMEISKYEHGKSLGNTLAEEYQAQIDPLSKEYEALKEKYSKIPLQRGKPDAPGTIGEIAEKVGNLAANEGWTASPSSDIMREVNRVLKELPSQKTIRDLDNYIRAVGDNMQSDPLNGSMRRAGGMIKSILKEAQADLIGKELGEREGLEAVGRYQTVRSSYAKQAALQEALDSRLHARGSTSGYAKSLREMGQTDGESLLRRISGTNDADLLNLLDKNFPRTAQALRAYHLDNMVNQAVSKAKPGEVINSKALIKSIGSMSPELRDFTLSREAAGKVEAIATLLEQMDKVPHNFSNTARALDSLNKYIPGSAVGLATVLLGHNPATAAVTGLLAGYLGKTVPDSIRLALLKFLGSAKPIEPGAFKAMVDFFGNAIKGENSINRAAKGLFKENIDVIPKSAIPDDATRKKLDKSIKLSQADPSMLMDIAGDSGHYIPGEAMAVGKLAATAVQFLNNLRPDSAPRNPLDSETPPSSVQQSAYNRALDIAEQPLMVMKSIKDGTVTMQDISALKAIYPSLYVKFSKKIMNEVVDITDKGQMIPYKTRLGISLFLGQPMDSTMTPEAIMAAQPQEGQPQNPSMQQPPARAKHSMTALNKLPGQYQTAQQNAEASNRSRRS